MPDIDTLMQEWSPEFEELLGKVSRGIGATKVWPLLEGPVLALFLCLF